MTAAVMGLLDTTVFIALESGREIGELPEETVTSVVVLGELEVGVLAASGSEVRARRLDTLRSVGDLTVLPIDEEVASVWAQMRVHLAESGRRVNVNDAWIAATAAAHRIPVVSQDDDFDPLEGVADLAVIKV
ncbi:type II toxin-antitoxin system VapC family toxin [soil metagenome]